MMNAAAQAMPLQQLSDDDRRWIAEQLMHGAEYPAIALHLINQGRSAEVVLAEVFAAQRSPVIIGALQGRDLWVNRLAKANWYLAIQAKLNRLNPYTVDIPTIRDISREAFYRDYYFANRPVILDGMMDHWPAMQRWNAEYFIEKFGERQVEVHANRDADPEYEIWRRPEQQTWSFRDFIEQARATKSNNLYMTARNGARNREQLNDLWDDLGDMPSCLAPTQPRGGFLWLGPEGTITQTHHDLTNNMLVQIVGRKRVHIVDGVFQPNIYNHVSWHARVNLADVDTNAFPLMQNVPVREVLLNPGQALFLPVGCWHQVESLDFSASITFTNFLEDNDFASFHSANGAL